MHRRLRLRSETIRQLAARELANASGGVPSSFPQCHQAARAGTSEAVGELCPTDYSFVCQTG